MTGRQPMSILTFSLGRWRGAMVAASVRWARGGSLALLLLGLVGGQGLARAAEGTGSSGGVPASAGLVPPAPPLPRSPVATFRRLLAQSPAERAAALARRSEAQRTALLARLAEYEALSPEVREERLWATDLFWHVQQLLPRAPAERGELIAAAPAELRGVLAERLAVWDALPAADRAALLNHERAIRYFARLREVVPPPLPGSPPLPVATRVRLSVDPPATAEGPHLTESDQVRLVETWRRFFDPRTAAGARQRERTLRAMPEPERRELDAVLARFQALPPAQRRASLESFARFASLSPAQQSGFVRSAERWASLSPDERRTWRGLAPKLPPLPPVPGTFRYPPLPTPVSGPTQDRPPAGG